VVHAVQRARSNVINGRITGTLLNLGLIVLVAVFTVVLIARVAEGGPSRFAQTLVYGLAGGAIYALIALGYTMVYGIIELINFAHGDVFTLGAFVSLALFPVLGLQEGHGLRLSGWLLIIATFVISMAVCGVVNVTIERLAYRPLRNAPRLAPLITAVGMSFVLEGIMYIWRGPFNLHYPDLLPGQRISLGGGATIGAKDMMVMGTAIILVVALTLFITRSKLGKAMRATAQDRDAAQLMGIDINRTISATFFIGAVLAAAGGTIFGLYYNNITFDQGFQAGLFAFTAAVFGGIGNIQGAALGGLFIGLTEALWNAYFLSSYTQVVIFAILILVLVFRPTGLLGMRVPEK
jgi:branched-chain amino acid transport system permease protein